MTRWIRLGLRLCVGSGRAGALRTVLMATGAAAGTVIVLAALAASTAYGEQYDRSLARTPAYEAGAETIQPPPRRVTGLTFTQHHDSIGPRQLLRVAVAGATPDSPLAPGLTHYPRVGEAIVSPALAGLIGTDARAAARFPQQVVGLIGDRGLVAPDELYAYVGVADDDPYLVGQPPVTAFRPEPPLWTLRPADVLTADRMAGVFFALFVLVPFGVLLSTCARLSASTRDRRIAALRLLGVSTRQAALVNAVETGVVAGTGSLLGYGLFRLLAAPSQGWHIGRLHWYAADLRLPVGVVGLVLAGTVGYAVAVGVLATRPVRIAPLRAARTAPARRPSLWRLSFLVAGMCLLVRGGTVGYVVALGLVGLGVPLAVPLLTWTIASVTARLPGGPVWWHLAAARLRHSPGVAPRLVASLTAALYVAGVGTLGITVVSENLVAKSPADSKVYQVSFLEPSLAEAINRAGGTVLRTAYLPALVGDTSGTVLVADCTTITATYQLRPGESCVDGEAYRVDFEPARDRLLTPVAIAAGTQVRDPAGGWSIPAPAPTLHLTPRLGFIDGVGLFITPASPVFGTRPPLESWSNIVVPDRAVGERIAQLLAAAAPANDLQRPQWTESGVDRTLLGTLLTVGLIISIGLGVASFAVAAIDRTVERRRHATTLTVVGTPARVVAASEFAFAAIPLAVGVVAATVAVVGMTLTLTRVFEVPGRPAADVLRSACGLSACALGVGLALITLPALVRRRVTAETLRRS